MREADKLYYVFKLHTFPGPNSTSIYEKKPQRNFRELLELESHMIVPENGYKLIIAYCSSGLKPTQHVGQIHGYLNQVKGKAFLSINRML